MENNVNAKPFKGKLVYEKRSGTSIYGAAGTATWSNVTAKGKCFILISGGIARNNSSISKPAVTNFKIGDKSIPTDDIAIVWDLDSTGTGYYGYWHTIALIADVDADTISCTTTYLIAPTIQVFELI